MCVASDHCARSTHRHGHRNAHLRSSPPPRPRLLGHRLRLPGRHGLLRSAEPALRDLPPAGRLLRADDHLHLRRLRGRRRREPFPRRPPLRLARPAARPRPGRRAEPRERRRARELDAPRAARRRPRAQRPVGRRRDRHRHGLAGRAARRASPDRVEPAGPGRGHRGEPRRHRLRTARRRVPGPVRRAPARRPVRRVHRRDGSRGRRDPPHPRDPRARRASPSPTARAAATSPRR
jgi:hypothetical protein